MAKQFLTPFPLNANSPVGKKVGIAANTNSNGVGAQIGNGGTAGDDMILVLTAGANDTYVYSVRFTPGATAASTATTATVLRIYQSSQTSGATTAANTTLIAEISAAAQTVDSPTSAIFSLEIPINRIIPTGQSILVSSHVVNAANTFWSAVCWGGDY